MQNINIVGIYRWKESNDGEYIFGYWWKKAEKHNKFTKLYVDTSNVVEEDSMDTASHRLCLIPKIIFDETTTITTTALNKSEFPHRLEKIYVVNSLHWDAGRPLYREGMGNAYSISKKLVAGTTNDNGKVLVDIGVKQFPHNIYYENLFENSY